MTTSVDFGTALKNTMRLRNNATAPETMRLKESVDSKDMTNKKITIDNLIIKTVMAKDKETNEPIVSKTTGENVYNAVVYVAFDGDYFFATKSKILVEQIENITGEKIPMDKATEITIGNFDGMKVKISTQKVRYADKKEYDNIVFDNA